MSNPRILAFAGSLRTGSLNKKLVRIGAECARAAGADVTVIDLRDYPLPLYDGDIEASDGLPQHALDLKTLFRDHHGLLLSCPEYNSSISAVLKNTIDWVSRPHGDEKSLACYDGKIAALMAASPGALGGLRGLIPVRSLLGNIRVLVLPDQVTVPGASNAFDAAGALIDEGVHAKVDALATRLAETVRSLKQ